MKSSLQRRLLVYVLSVTTLFLLIISVMNFWWAHDMVVDISEKRAAAEADAASARIQGYLLQKGQHAWTLAQNEQIHAFVRKINTGEVDLSHDNDYEQMLTSFQRIVDENSDIKFVYVGVEKTQRLYANTEFTYPPGYKVSDRPWYQMAIQKRSLVYSTPYICPLTGNYVVTASVPFYDTHGELLGVASVDILVDEIRKIVSNVHIFNNDYAFLLDADGKLITNPKDKPYSEFLAEIEAGYPQMEQVLDKMVVGKQGLEKITLKNSDKYVFYTPIERIGWSMALVVPADEVTSSIYTLGRISFTTILIGILVICLLMSYLTSRIIRPLNSFSHLMEKVGEGDYSLRAVIYSNDEIGHLGTSLNNMLDKQQRLIEQVIQTAYKMCIAGQQLAITIGEARITLPMVTLNAGDLLSNQGLPAQPEENLNPDQLNRDLTETVILLMHTQRTISSRLKDLQVLLQLNEANDNNVLATEILLGLKEIDAQCQEIQTSIENLQLGLTELYAITNRMSNNSDDMQNTLQKVSKHIGTIAELQSDSIERATQTAHKLLEWSQTLMENTSLFRINRD